jgi:hypothetical protein
MLLHVIQLLKLALMFYHVSLDIENHEYDDEDGVAQSQSNKDFKRAILLCYGLLERRDGTTGLTARAASETEKPQVSWLCRPRSSVDPDGTNWCWSLANGRHLTQWRSLVLPSRSTGIFAASERQKQNKETRQLKSHAI